VQVSLCTKDSNQQQDASHLWKKTRLWN